jgi:hypothetical protein
MKRRLVLMPEVLPDPTPHWDKGAPRSRTLDHLARLRGETIVAERKGDGTIEIRVRNVPPEAVPFGYGIAFVRRDGDRVRFRPLAGVEAVSLVIGKTSVRVAMSDLAVTLQEIP